jgi:hypothetical protein
MNKNYKENLIQTSNHSELPSVACIQSILNFSLNLQSFLTPIGRIVIYLN